MRQGTRRRRRRLGESGVLVVDAPVSGEVARAATGDLLMMVSGSEAALATARPLLDALSRTSPVVGPEPGDGQKVKLVNQLLCGVHIGVAAEALAFAESLGSTLAPRGRCFATVSRPRSCSRTAARACSITRPGRCAALSTSSSRTCDLSWRQRGAVPSPLPGHDGGPAVRRGSPAGMGRADAPRSSRFSGGVADVAANGPAAT